MTVNPARIRCLKDGTQQDGPVVYWMSRDQRIADNWALHYAQEIALEKKVPLIILFCVVPEFLDAGIRQYAFMFDGLKEAAVSAETYSIPFFLHLGSPEQVIPEFIVSHKCSVMVTDFDPLRIKRRWKDGVLSVVHIPFHEVDAHNIVPCWRASQKREYSAFTIRKKINACLAEFLDVFPAMQVHPYRFTGEWSPPDFRAAERSLSVNTGIPPVNWLQPGEKHAFQVLDSFLHSGLGKYAESANDPNAAILSNLSPYIHFGQISAQRAALEASRYALETGTNAEAFLEQLVVRRELAENFCYYCSTYDSLESAPEWGRRTLDEHRDDPREYIYTLEEFETARTHDPLWNAAQFEMVFRGKMHSYLRMYWAKKILEWTLDPETALTIAIRLNDTYELDGRDPNGYTGIMWSIAGLHDRAWSERQVFGKIRYMNYNGCKRKFDVAAYIRSIDALKREYS